MKLVLHLRSSVWFSLAVSFLCSNSLAREFDINNPLNPPASVYWCPDRPSDQNVVTKPKPGCVPLYDKEDEKKKLAEAKAKGIEVQPKELIDLAEVQNESSKFAERYRKFLECCANDVGSLDTLKALEEESSLILKSVQLKGAYNSAGSVSASAGGNSTLGTFARQWTLSGIVGTVARARYELGRLKERLEQLQKEKESLDSLGEYAAAQTRLRIQIEEEAIAKEFRAKAPPPAPRTGMEIGDTTIPTRIGGKIEDTSLGTSFGADITNRTSPYSEVQEGLHPRRGEAIQDTTLPNRFGPETRDTNLPNRFGFESDDTTAPKRVGPSIGDSTLNQR